MPEESILRLVMADGRILDQSECGYADQKLWCYLKDLTFAEAFQIFSDPEKTSVIKFEYGLENRFTRITYAGFSDIVSINKREFTIDVCLTGTDTDIQQEEVIPDESAPIYDTGENQH